VCFCLSDNLFEAELPPSLLTELPILTTSRLSNGTKDMVEIKFNVECFAAATVFAERGAYSEHIYQVSVNPRQLNYESYIRTSEAMDKSTVPSLVWSMLYPKDISWFSNSNPMRLYPYEIFAKDNDGGRSGIRLTTAAPLTYPVELTEDGDTILSIQKEARLETAPGKIRSFRGYSLTVEGFIRTLAVFGYCRATTYADRTHVEAIEIASLLSEIGSVKLGTMAGLVAFVKKFNLEQYIDLDADLDVPANHCKVSKAIRVLCPLRLAAFDGRHRFNLCCHYFHGQFYPTNTLFMKPMSLAEAVKLVTYEGQEAQADAVYETCELFKTQCFVVAVEDYAKKATFESAVVAMQAAGDVANGSQKLQVQSTWPSAISELTTRLIESRVIKERKPLGAKFWGAMTYTLPYLQDIDIVIAYADKGESTRQNLFKGSSKATWTEVKTAVVQMGKKYTYPIGYVAEVKAPPKVPKELAVFATLVKMMGHDSRNYVEIRNYFQQSTWSLEQVDMITADVTSIRSLNSLQQLILHPVATATKHLAQKYVVERHIMEFIRTANNDPHVAEDIGQSWGVFDQCNQHHFHFERFVNTEVTEAALGAASTSKKTGKLQFALHAYLLTNAIKTFNAVGPNFVLKNKGERCVVPERLPECQQRKHNNIHTIH
jgi:hypothetical protein